MAIVTRRGDVFHADWVFKTVFFANLLTYDRSPVYCHFHALVWDTTFNTRIYCVRMRDLRRKHHCEESNNRQDTAYLFQRLSHHNVRIMTSL